MNKASFVINIILCVLVIILCLLLFNRKFIDSGVDRTEYVTDTFIVERPYKVPVPYKDTAKPRVVIGWLSPKSNDSLILINDSLIRLLDSLGNLKYDINGDFLKLYPTSPKLISLELDIDTLSITTMGIQANVSTNKYPLWLLSEKYLWIDGTLTYKKVPHKNTPIKPYYLSLYPNYSFYDKSLGIDARIGTNLLKWIQVEGTTGYTIYTKQLRITGGVVIKLH